MRKRSLGCGNFTVSQLSIVRCAEMLFFLYRSQQQQQQRVSWANYSAGYCCCLCWNVVRIHKSTTRAYIYCMYFITAFGSSVQFSFVAIFRARAYRSCCCVFFAHFPLLEQTNWRAVDIQQWHRTHTIIISSNRILLIFLFEFWFSSVLFRKSQQFFKARRKYNETTRTVRVSKAREEPREFWRCVFQIICFVVFFFRKIFFWSFLDRILAICGVCFLFWCCLFLVVYLWL